MYTTIGLIEKNRDQNALTTVVALSVIPRKSVLSDVESLFSSSIPSLVTVPCLYTRIRSVLPTLKPSQISHLSSVSSLSTSSNTLDSGSTYASAKWFSKVSSAIAELDQVGSASRRCRRRGSTSIQSFCLLNSRFSEAYIHCTRIYFTLIGRFSTHAHTHTY